MNMTKEQFILAAAAAALTRDLLELDVSIDYHDPVVVDAVITTAEGLLGNPPDDTWRAWWPVVDAAIMATVLTWTTTKPVTFTPLQVWRMETHGSTLVVEGVKSFDLNLYLLEAAERARREIANH